MITNDNYVCPGCLAHDMAPDCTHSERDWELAEAMRDGTARLHHETPAWGTPTEMAWAFADDAAAISDRVGEPPYRVEFTHPGGHWSTLGLVNGTHLIALPDEEGDDVVMEALGDITPLLKPPHALPTTPEGIDQETLALAAELVISTQFGSTSMLQRKLSLGFARAGAVMDWLEAAGIVGAAVGWMSRDVLVPVSALDATLKSIRAGRVSS